MQVGELRCDLLHVLLVVLRLHLVELHVHLRLPPGIGLSHDRRESKIAADVGALGNL